MHCGFEEAGKSNYIVDFLSTSEGLQFNCAFITIKDAKIRRKSWAWSKFYLKTVRNSLRLLSPKNG
jgi:hypothetical protein